jgi:hypothetical protein
MFASEAALVQPEKRPKKGQINESARRVLAANRLGSIETAAARPGRRAPLYPNSGMPTPTGIFFFLLSTASPASSAPELSVMTPVMRSNSLEVWLRT